MRVLAGVICLGLWLTGASAGPQPSHDSATAPRPLREFTAEAGVATDGLAPDALDAVALDFAAERSANAWAIAYRVAMPDGRTRLHVRTRALDGPTWLSAAFDETEATRGSVTQVRDAGATLLVDLERDDRVGDVLVLDKTLGRQSHVEGTLVDVLPDGSVLYRENLEAQRPARPLAVSVFVPATGRHQRIYPPATPVSAARQAYVDRARRAFAGWGLTRCLAEKHPCNAEQFDAFIVSDVRATTRGHRLAWIVRFGPAEGEATGPVTFRAHVVVSCDRPERAVGANCREVPFGNYDGPDGTNTRGALAVALVRRGERLP